MMIVFRTYAVQTGVCMASTWERGALLTGALAVPFWVAGVILVSTKATGSKGPEILAAYGQHSNGILVGALLWSIGVLLFIWFLGSLRSHYLAAEGGDGRPATSPTAAVSWPRGWRC